MDIVDILLILRIVIVKDCESDGLRLMCQLQI